MLLECVALSRSVPRCGALFAANHFYKLKFPLFPVRGMLAPGCYSFPFTFQLPVGLPGTFHLDGSRKRAHIR